METKERTVAFRTAENASRAVEALREAWTPTSKSDPAQQLAAALKAAEGLALVEHAEACGRLLRYALIEYPSCLDDDDALRTAVGHAATHLLAELGTVPYQPGSFREEDGASLAAAAKEAGRQAWTITDMHTGLILDDPDQPAEWTAWIRDRKLELSGEFEIASKAERRRFTGRIRGGMVRLVPQTRWFGLKKAPPPAWRKGDVVVLCGEAESGPLKLLPATVVEPTFPPIRLTPEQRQYSRRVEPVPPVDVDVDPAVAELWEQLNDDWIEAQEALAKLGRPAVPSLMKLLQGQGSPEQIEHAIEVLGTIGDPQAFDVCLEACLGTCDSDPTGVGPALASMNAERHVAMLTQILARYRARWRHWEFVATALVYGAPKRGVVELARLMANDLEASQGKLDFLAGLIDAHRDSWEPFCELGSEDSLGIVAVVYFVMGLVERPDGKRAQAELKEWAEVQGVFG